MNFDLVRAALLRERKDRVGARAKMEELSGVSEGTIFKIEKGWVDPRTRQSYVPSADLLLKLISALPGLTVGEFFARLEGEAAPPLESQTPEATEHRAPTDVVSALERIAERLTPPAGAGTTVLTLPFALDEGERVAVVEAAVDIARARDSSQTASRSPRRRRTTERPRKQG